jgi:hypothetical protein
VADLLLSLAVLLLVVVVVGLVGLALTVLPFVQALEAAERRGLSTTRTGALALAGSGAGLLGSFAAHRAGAPLLDVVAPLAVCWVVPVVAALLPPGAVRAAGRRGAHE